MLSMFTPHAVRIGLLVTVAIAVALTTASRTIPTAWTEIHQGKNQFFHPGWSNLVDKPRTHKVHLLVGRHGLSCANFIEQFGSSYDLGRYFMSDPHLTGAGMHASNVSGAQAAKWLAEKNLTVDAVISSVLLRAMETALMTYPGHELPLVVAPFIRETAMGPSNLPLDKEPQITKIREVAPEGSQVDYHWTNIFDRLEDGNWPNFVNFLSNSFLPDLILSLGKTSGEPIVLAIATHSLLMMENDEGSVGEQCENHWHSNYKHKPQNNQIVYLPYIYNVLPPKPNNPDFTPNYSLEQDREGTCVQVAQGLEVMQAQDEKPIRGSFCAADIGETCFDAIMKESYNKGALLKRVLEHQILKLAEDIVTLERETNRLWTEISDEMSKYSFAIPKNAITKKALAAANDLIAGNKQERLNQMRLMFGRKQESLDRAKHARCWVGGFPNVESYLKQRPGLQLDAAARELALAQVS